MDDTTIVDGDTVVVTEFVWEAVGGNGDRSFLVVQVGDIVYFYDVSTSLDISSNKKSFTVDLNDHLPPSSARNPGVFECDYTVGSGVLIIVNRATQPIYVTYDSSGDTITDTSIVLQQRDLVGLDDTLNLLDRPTESVATLVTNNPEHYYNIINQGWHAGDALTQWDGARTDMPGNADVVSLFRSSQTDAFDTNIVDSKSGFNSPAPKGHFILDVGNPDRGTALTDEGFNSIPADTQDSTVADSAGTIFTIETGDFNGLAISGQTNAFDGDTTETFSNSARGTPAQFLEGSIGIGKIFDDPGIRVVSAQIWPSSDQRYVGDTGSFGDYSVTAQLRGSNSLPSSPTSGTLLDSDAFSGTVTGSRTLTSSNTSTFYKYVWVRVRVVYSGGGVGSINPNVAEVRFVEREDVGGGEVSFSGATTVERPCCVEFFNSRVFYAGINQSGLSNKIFYSQVIEDEDQYGRCYQANDPTAEDFFDLLATDGGVITIPELGTVKNLVAIRSAVLVFATNGVWIIRGSDNSGFSATSNTVEKLSDIGTSSSKSFVSVRGLPLWWGEDGIFRIVFNPDFNSFSVESVTDESIRTFITDIPTKNRKFVKGAYDSEESIIYWLYNDNASLADDDVYTYNGVVAYNTISNAFYPWQIGEPTNGPQVVGLSYVSDAERLLDPVVKYTTLVPDTSTNVKTGFSEASNTSYTDWQEYATNVSANADDEIDYTSYFITGYRLDGEAQRFFQAPYLFVYIEKEQDSSCFVQPIFDFTNDRSSGKWGTKQQIYGGVLRHTDVHTRRLKLRGKGRALQLKFQSVSGKPFKLIGWSLRESSNADV